MIRLTSAEFTTLMSVFEQKGRQDFYEQLIRSELTAQTRYELMLNWVALGYGEVPRDERRKPEEGTNGKY